MKRLALVILALSLLAALGSAQGRKFAVVVGVSQYLVPDEQGKGGFSSLRYAHSDAERMAKRLTELGWQVTLLQSVPGAKATGAGKVDVLNAVQSVQSKTDDTFLFYFSGHGVRLDGQDYLVPGDAFFENVSTDPQVFTWKASKSSLISYVELKAGFEKCRLSSGSSLWMLAETNPRRARTGTPSNLA